MFPLLLSDSLYESVSGMSVVPMPDLWCNVSCAKSDANVSDRRGTKTITTSKKEGLIYDIRTEHK